MSRLGIHLPGSWKITNSHHYTQVILGRPILKIGDKKYYQHFKKIIQRASGKYTIAKRAKKKKTHSNLSVLLRRTRKRFWTLTNFHITIFKINSLKRWMSFMVLKLYWNSWKNYGRLSLRVNICSKHSFTDMCSAYGPWMNSINSPKYIRYELMNILITQFQNSSL